MPKINHGHTERLFNLRQRLPGVLNATQYFHVTMGDVLDGYIDKIGLVWVDDVVICGEAPEILLKRLLVVFDRLLNRGLFGAAHKPVFFRREIMGCGKILSGQTVSNDSEGTQGMIELHRPERAGELMQFLQVINWVITSLHELAEVEAPLRALLDACLRNTRGTETVAVRRAIGRNEWTDERMAACDAVRLRVSE